MFRLLFICCLFTSSLFAQGDTGSIGKILRNNIDILAGPDMQGRGYVDSGRERAAAFIQRRFTDLGIKPLPDMGSYLQEYSFSVNDFPGKMKLVINGTELKPGDDYLIDAGSASFSGSHLKVVRIDMSAIHDSAAWLQTLAGFDEHKAWYLANTAAFLKTMKMRERDIVAELPKGCYIIPETAKLTWTVSRVQNEATVFYVKESSLPRKLKKVDAAVLARFEPDAKSTNIIAAIPGTIKDSFIVFSAHYDHLGKMGGQAVFPGASDNASGTAMLLYLASYYASRPQRYTMVFIAFSGEEAGLMGSKNFIAHTPIPLANIKFLTNIDIMGDATDGVTVVNATEYPNQFSLLTAINEEHKYLPAVKSRGKAANSDHYYFSEAGVPAFFFYSNGGKGYYHDIFDKPGEITLKNVDGVAHLLMDFVSKLK
jgi:aminopeptidase YwaD